jgi:hypothetical protein
MIEIGPVVRTLLQSDKQKDMTKATGDFLFHSERDLNTNRGHKDVLTTEMATYSNTNLKHDSIRISNELNVFAS